jgi:hypothetical protein
MNESIARSRTRGSPRWREKTMIARSVNQTYLYMSHYIIHGLEFYIKINAKIVLHEKLNKEHMKRNLETFEAYQKEDSCIQIEEDNLVKNLQCTTEAW